MGRSRRARPPPTRVRWREATAPSRGRRLSFRPPTARRAARGPSAAAGNLAPAGPRAQWSPQVPGPPPGFPAPPLALGALLPATKLRTALLASLWSPSSATPLPLSLQPQPAHCALPALSVPPPRAPCARTRRATRAPSTLGAWGPRFPGSERRGSAATQAWEPGGGTEELLARALLASIP